ncbi:MAG TPA: portal protein [Polyangia bacterium]|nr:portal protein [Polyangia bacterium]
MTAPMIAGVPMAAFPGAQLSSARQRAEEEVTQMEYSRSTMISWWKDCAAFFSPRSPRFENLPDNRGPHLNRHIIDETPIFARRTLESGMHWGITNPSRRWFELKSGDPDLDEDGNASDFLHVSTDRIFSVLSRSNFYDTQALAYSDVITYGTAAYLVEEDERDVINCVPFAIGSFGIADDARREVTSVSRKFWMTLRQLVEKFAPEGEDGVRDTSALSMAALNALEKKEWGQRFQVTHLISPNEDYDPDYDLPQHWEFKSCYWETGSLPKNTNKQWLQRGGYREWPVMVFRWRRAQDEPWGIDSPAMQCLASAKSLQKMESKGLKLLEKLVDPPMTGPGELESKSVSILPGAFTATRDGNVAFKAAHEVRAEGLTHLREDKEAVRQRVHDMFYTRLMMLIANDTRKERPTAREVEEGSQEKYLVLGSVLESFNGTFKRFIDRVYNIMDRRGFIPEAPEELGGVPLQVEYTSIMAVAQKSVGLANIERFGSFVAEMIAATADPRMAAKIDWGEYVDALASRSGLPPGMIRSNEDVDAILEQQAAAADQERQAALMEQEAAAMKDMSETPLGGNNAMTALTNASQQGSLGAGIGAPA